MLALEHLARLPGPSLQQDQLLAGLGLVGPDLSPGLSSHHGVLVTVPTSVGELDPPVPNLRLPEVGRVIVQTRPDLEVSVQRLEVTGEGFEVVELLLEICAEEEPSDLDPGVDEETGVERPGVEVRVVVSESAGEVQ